MNLAVLVSVPINRMKRLLPHLFASGDDDGVIKVSMIQYWLVVMHLTRVLNVKLWDPRKQDAIRKYTHHFDFISDFMWLDDQKQLVATRYESCYTLQP